jgi:hypothetical protein
MDLWIRIVLGVVFFAIVAALIRWKRPTLWSKIVKPFIRTSHSPTPQDPSNPQG